MPPPDSAHRRNPRLRGFINHLAIWFIVMMLLIAINLATAAGHP